MTTIDERGLSHLKEPTLSYTPYSLVDPAQHQPLAARGRLCRAALLVSSVMVIGSLFVTKVGLDSRDAVSLASVVAKGSKKGPAPLSVKDPVEMGFPPIPRAGPAAPTKLWGKNTRNKARPTCAWWENFALGDGQAPNANVFAVPYILTVGAGIVVDYPSTAAAGDHIFQSVASVAEQVTLGAKEMKAPTIIPVSDGSPFRRQLGDKLGAATPKGGATPKRQLGDDAKLCNEIPRATCGAPHEICFHDTLCPGGGPGCGAGGDASCRFCGFGDFDACPASSGPTRTVPVANSTRHTGQGPSPPPPPPPAAPAAKAPPATRPIVYSKDHEVSGFDALVVNVSFASGAAVAPLLQGSPYVTMLYDGTLTPMVTSVLIGSATEVDGKKVACGKGMQPVLGSKFRVEFAQADSAWVAYSSEPVEWDCSASTKFNFTVLTEKFAGSVRIALASNCSTGADPHHRCSVRGQPDDHSAYEALLDRHAGAVPVAGVVSHSVAPSSHDAALASVELDLSWTLAPRHASKEEASLLMLALPHQHHNMAPAPLPSSHGMHRTVRGAALAVVGDSWTVTNTAPMPAFEAATPIDPAMLPALRSSLVNGTKKDRSDADLHFDLPGNFKEGIADPYFSGKMLSKMAYIALIANTSAVGLGKEGAKLLPKLKQYIEVWLHHKSGNALMFDTSWGGIISCGCQFDDCEGKCKPTCTNSGPPDGCPAVGDVGMDFGNAWYNDHHFHYGYHIYAYAVLAAFDPEWGAKNLEHIMVMVRDIANPSKDDPFFPVHRHKDWYMGHSWASGIAVPGGKPNFLGRNQESTSEAVNAWYAISLLGQVVGRDDVRDLGLALLATELKSAKTYWHTAKGSDIYPAPFAAGAAVGMLWSSMAQQQTWFGVQPYYIHGIQMLPVTPASEALLEPEWLKTETPVFAASCGEVCVTQGWSVPLRLAQAVHDPTAALAAIKKLPPDVFDSANAGGNGNSRTGSYYWVATRPAQASSAKKLAQHASSKAKFSYSSKPQAPN